MTTRGEGFATIAGTMFHVRHVQGELPTIELADDAAGSLAVVAPGRGGMLTRLRVGDDELLYMDEATLRDPSKNVRGGNPVLFPSPGKLEGDRWEQAGRSGALKQHGFARNLPWQVEQESAGDDARVTLRLDASDATRASYPWDFEARFTYALSGKTVRIEQRFTNRSASPMPFGAGFHPYFHVPQAHKKGASIATGATRAFDNVQKRVVDYRPFDLTSSEVDMHLLDHGSTEATLAWAGRGVKVSASPEFSHWVVWTLGGRDFVCLEPWTSPGDALNTGEKLLRLEPGETRALWVSIAAL